MYKVRETPGTALLVWSLFKGANKSTPQTRKSPHFFQTRNANLSFPPFSLKPSSQQLVSVQEFQHMPQQTTSDEMTR